MHKLLWIGLTGLASLILIGPWSTVAIASQLPSQTTSRVAVPTNCASNNDSTGVEAVGISASTYADGNCIFVTATSSEGQVAAGQAPPLGHLNAPIVGIAALNDSQGYWLVGSDGGVFAMGGAPFFGSAAKIHLNAPIVESLPHLTMVAITSWQPMAGCSALATPRSKAQWAQRT